VHRRKIFIGLRRRIRGISDWILGLRIKESDIDSGFLLGRTHSPSRKLWLSNSKVCSILDRGLEKDDLDEY
jgi:hypothetical protein